MNISINHNCTKEDAKRKMDIMIQRLKGEYGSQIQRLKEHWTDHIYNIEGVVKGYPISGSIKVEKVAIDIDLKIPFLLQVFSKKIKSEIEKVIKSELS